MAKSDLFSKPNYNKYNFFNDEYRLMLKKPQLETELISVLIFDWSSFVEFAKI